MSKTTGKIVLGLPILLLVSWFSFIVYSSFFSHSIASGNPENYNQVNNQEPEDYTPKKEYLYPLYLSDVQDTVVRDDDTTILVLKVQVIKSWKPDSVDHKKINR